MRERKRMRTNSFFSYVGKLFEILSLRWFSKVKNRKLAVRSLNLIGENSCIYNCGYLHKFYLNIKF